MTKAKTKAQRRRTKRITLPGGESVPQRATGRDRSHTNQPQEAADMVVLTARARRTGCTVEEARDIIAASDMGRCIRAMIPNRQERHDLLDTWQGICAAKRNHDLRIIGRDPNPQAASIAMMPEAMQTNDSHSVDLRTAEERDDAARRIWHHWLEQLMMLPADQRHALRGHLDGYAAELWDVAHLRPTRAGALAVKALGKLHEMGRG